MYRAGTSWAMVAVAALLLAVRANPVATAQAPTSPQPPAAPTAMTSGLGVVIGTAWRGDTQPYPQPRIRLRNVATGRTVARTIGDAQGRFQFERVEPSAYVVELVSGDEKVLAVSDLFGVPSGGQVSTVVRLSSKAPWAAGFFGNAAAAAISAASAIGVTAIGSSGTPASAQ
jgi:hypothetical protein